MMQHLIGIVVGMLICLPMFLLGLSSRKAILGEITDKPFVCPNCGHKFYVKWYKMWFKNVTVYSYGAAKLKCPACRITDMCRHDDK